MSSLLDVYPTSQVCVREINKTHSVKHVCNTANSVRMSSFTDPLDPNLSHYYGTGTNIEIANDINDDDIVVRDSRDAHMTYRFDNSEHTMKERVHSRTHEKQRIVVDKSDRVVWAQTNMRACRDRYGQHFVEGKDRDGRPLEKEDQCRQHSEKEIVGRLISGAAGPKTHHTEASREAGICAVLHSGTCKLGFEGLPSAVPRGVVRSTRLYEDNIVPLLSSTWRGLAKWNVTP